MMRNTKSNIFLGIFMIKILYIKEVDHKSIN